MASHGEAAARGDAEVRLHGRRIGHLRFDRGGSSFTYEDDLSSPGHAVLGQSFEDDPVSVRRVRVGLPNWFANVLPEGALRRQVIREMGGGNIGDYTLLLRLGRDLPGAVTVHGETEPDDDLSPLSDADVGGGRPLRHSLAGFQLKFSVASEKLTFPVRGGSGWWIAKLPDRTIRDLIVNEYLTMRWLAAAAFPVPPNHLVPAHMVSTLRDALVEAHENVYLIERFDRNGTDRVHVEDFAQIADVAPMFKYSESGVTYESIGAVIHTLCGADDFGDYLRRVVAMLVVGNTDAHLKNWALIYPDGTSPRLAPVYDFHSLTIYGRFRHQPLALSLGGERLPGRIGAGELRRLAQHCGVDPQWADQVVAGAVDALRTAWYGGVQAEAQERFAALADHYTRRLDTLLVCAA